MQTLSKKYPCLPIKYSRPSFFLAVLIILALAAGVGQDAGAQEREKPAPLNLSEFSAIATPSSKLHIANLNFNRRYDRRGAGEFLDVSFDIVNQTSEPIEIYAYVLACYYRDAVNDAYRKLLPHPPWRKRDFDKETFLVQYIAITPQAIPDHLIWDTNDPDYRFYQRAVSRLRNSPENFPIADAHPSLWKYLQYMQRYPTQGLKFTLYGPAGPSEQEMRQSNWIPATPEEKRSKDYRNYEKHTYSLFHRARQTLFHSHHYARFTEGYQFFNLVAVQLFDAQVAEEYEAAEGRTPPGEDPRESLIYRRIIHLKNPLKN